MAAPALALGAADVAEAAADGGGAVPVGIEKPVTPPEKGPAGAEADAPCPTRPPSPWPGLPGEDAAALWKAGKVSPEVGALIEL